MSTLNNTVVAPSLTPNTPAQPQPVMQQPMQQPQVGFVPTPLNMKVRIFRNKIDGNKTVTLENGTTAPKWLQDDKGNFLQEPVNGLANAKHGDSLIITGFANLTVQGPHGCMDARQRMNNLNAQLPQGLQAVPSKTAVEIPHFADQFGSMKVALSPKGAWVGFIGNASSGEDF